MVAVAGLSSIGAPRQLTMTERIANCSDPKEFGLLRDEIGRLPEGYNKDVYVSMMKQKNITPIDTASARELTMTERITNCSDPKEFQQLYEEIANLPEGYNKDVYVSMLKQKNINPVQPINPRQLTMTERIANCSDPKEFMQLCGEVGQLPDGYNKDIYTSMIRQKSAEFEAEALKKLKNITQNVTEKGKAAVETVVENGKNAAEQIAETVAENAKKVGKGKGWIIGLGCGLAGLALGGVAGASSNNHKLDAVA